MKTLYLSIRLALQLDEAGGLGQLQRNNLVTKMTLKTSNVPSLLIPQVASSLGPLLHDTQQKGVSIRAILKLQHLCLVWQRHYLKAFSDKAPGSGDRVQLPTVAPCF